MKHVLHVVTITTATTLAVFTNTTAHVHPNIDNQEENYDFGALQQQLISAAQEGRINQVQALLSYNLDVNTRDNRGRTALHWATRNAHPDVMRELLNHGAEANLTDADGWAPLHFATHRNNPACIELLVDYNANPSLQNPRTGTTPLHLAANSGYIEATQALSSINANTNTCDNEGNTPLHYAAQRGHSNVMELLISNGAYVDATNVQLQTPLHYAALNNHVKTINLLLRHNASVTKTDTDGRSALHLATINNKPIPLGTLILDQPLVMLHSAATNQTQDNNSLGDNPLDENPMNAINSNDYIPMQSIGRIRDNAIVEITIFSNSIDTLIQYGAQVDLLDSNRQTPLHRAALAGNIHATAALLKNGAPLTGEDSNHKTPVQLAEECQHHDVATLLRNQQQHQTPVTLTLLPQEK